MGVLGDRPLDREELRLKLQAACASADGAPLSADLGVPVEVTAGAPAGVPAAVLIGLVAHPEGPGVILTERTAHLANHAAEISLPGGKVETTDDGPAAAALREAFEEIGLSPEKVELLGCLLPHRTITGFQVHPFVGWIEPPVEFTPDTHEVADIFEVPLRFVVDPANHQRESLFIDGGRHEFYVLPYPGHRIWGATAGILVSLARVLAS
jgi:8-oxo-dGTP pyrophosphatase MutT (NUDIX family)